MNCQVEMTSSSKGKVSRVGNRHSNFKQRYTELDLVFGLVV